MNRLALSAVALLLAGCILDGEYKKELTTVPEPLGDGWEIASVEGSGLSPDSLAKVYRTLHASDRHFNALGLLVAVDGKLVWETYLRDPSDRDRFHHVQSTTKTVTSLALGVAMDSGWIPNLDTTFCQVVPEPCPGEGDPRRRITLRHLLTMRSGLAFDNDDFAYDMYVGRPSDPLRHILSKPLYADPGTTYYYRDADPHLAGAMIQRMTGRDEMDIARTHLLDPMECHGWFWERAPGGLPMAGHGLYLRPRDLLKIAQLGLDSGAWKGRQLVSRTWMRSSMALQVDPGFGGAHSGPMQYGHYWWRLPAIGAASTWGHGGQFAFFLPGRKLAIAMVSMPDSNEDVGTDMDHFIELISPLLH